MAFNETIPQFTVKTKNHADNFNEVNNKLLDNTKHNKQLIELLEKTLGITIETLEANLTTKIDDKVDSSTYLLKVAELVKNIETLELALGTHKAAYDTKMTALDTKNTEQDTAIADKVKLNGTQANVNFTAEDGKLTSVELGGKKYNFPTSEYAFSIDTDGMLVVTYRDNTVPPDFSIDEDGCLTLTI